MTHNTKMVSPKTGTVVEFEADKHFKQYLQSGFKVTQCDTCVWPIMAQDRFNSALRNSDICNSWSSYQIRDALF